MMEKHRKAAGIGFALAAAMTVVFIFSNSLQSAEISGAVSGGILKAINSWIEARGLITISEQLLRKCAHLFEFGILGLFASSATLLLSHPTAKSFTSPAVATATASVIAICDETIQYFVPGRACLITDMLIDTLGAAIGTATVTLIHIAIERHRKNRKIKIKAPKN